jgi:hypothetical protein
MFFDYGCEHSLTSGVRSFGWRSAILSAVTGHAGVKPTTNNNLLSYSIWKMRKPVGSIKESFEPLQLGLPLAMISDRAGQL